MPQMAPTVIIETSDPFQINHCYFYYIDSDYVTYETELDTYIGCNHHVHRDKNSP